jgi:hypothetical protein
MEVNFNSSQNRISNYSPAVSRQSAPSSADNTDSTMSFQRTKTLEQTLRQTPTVRPEKVAQAKALAADPAYPSDQVLSKVSGLLAKHISS